MKKLFTILMGMLGMVSVSCAKGDSIQSVNVNEFEKQIKNKHVQLVDVRTADEYAGGFIAKFMQRAASILNKKEKVYVYCRSGKRSMTAARRLAGAGYKVVNLEGGIMAWNSAGKPVVR